VLERELEKRRATQAGGVGVEGLGGEGEGAELGGLDATGASSFRFSDWEGGEVPFMGTFVRVGEKNPDTMGEKEPLVDGLASLREWLEGL
jgi:signal recognition particle receptor subunit beta